MFQLLFTDFIRNRTIQFTIALGLLFDIILSSSIKHSLILFGLPYLTSIALCFRYEPRRKRIKARISAQYRNKSKS